MDSDGTPPAAQSKSERSCNCSCRRVTAYICVPLFAYALSVFGSSPSSAELIVALVLIGISLIAFYRYWGDRAMDFICCRKDTSV